MSNAFATPKVYANVGLALLKNQLVMAKLCDSEAVNKEFVPGVGTTVYVKKPPEFAIRDGAVAASQDVLEGEVAVVCDKQKGVDVQFTGYEATTNVDQLLKSKVIAGAMTQIASQIDGDLIANVKFFHNAVGTYGNTISTVAGFFAGPQRLDEMAVPMSDRNAILTPADGYALAGTFTGLAALAGDTAVSALQKAKIPMLGNTSPYITQTVPSMTMGTRVQATGTSISGANQNSTYASTRTTGTQTLTLTTGSGKTVKAGEKFTIANVWAVNPRTKAKMSYLKQFTVTADATAVSTALTVTISPPIITSGAYQNVDLTGSTSTTAPDDSAAVVWFGALSTSYNLNAAFHKSAIKLVNVTPPRPYTGESDYATDPATGISVRYWRYSDGTNDLHNHRWDVYYGTKNVDPRLGTVLFGA
jgi:hypothetical protein